MGVAVKYIPHYTYEDWLHWEGRWELIDGVPIAMSPMPVPSHQQTAGDLFYRFKDALEAGCDNCAIYLPIDYKLSDDTIFQPDLLVVCGEINKPYLDFSPALIIEVLSKSTEERDRGIKYDYYEQQGVKYYLIVDWKKKTIEIYELINNKYQLQPYKSGFEFQLNDGCKICPELDNVWE
jgi:Uma2 family endonuclease